MSSDISSGTMGFIHPSVLMTNPPEAKTEYNTLNKWKNELQTESTSKIAALIYGRPSWLAA